MSEREAGVLTPVGWEEIEAELLARGWQLRVRQVWAIEAHRGGECEEVLATSREEAFTRLRELARVYDAPHYS